MSRKIRNPDSAPIKDPVIEEFLNAQSKKTRKTYASYFKKILEFSKGESGASMLKNVETWSRKIMAFQQYMIEQGYSLNTVECCTGILRGFYAYFRKPLDLSKADKRKLGRQARNSEDYAPTQQEIKKLYDVASLEQRYVLTCGISFGIRAEDFTSLNFGKYRLALERAKAEEITTPIPLGEIVTGKEFVKAYPFISSDALPIIQAILDLHPNSRDEDPVYTNGNNQLTATLQTLAFKAGIDLHGQRFRFHCLRKFLFDRLISVSSNAKASQIIGHKIGGEIAPYIGQGSLREVFERAQPSILITNGNGETKAKVTALEQKNKDLEERNKALEDKLKALQREQTHVTTTSTKNESRITELEEKLDKLTKLLEGKT